MEKPIYYQAYFDNINIITKITPEKCYLFIEDHYKWCHLNRIIKKDPCQVMIKEIKETISNSRIEFNEDFPLSSLYQYNEEFGLLENNVKFDVWKHIEYDYQRIFITEFDGNNDTRYNTKINTSTTYFQNNKSIVYHSLDVAREIKYQSTIGKLLLINTFDNEYILVSYFIIKFKTPDNDKIIYVSQGDQQNHFLIGDKYSYRITHSIMDENHHYISNEIMYKYNKINPNDVYYSSEFEKNKYFKKLDIEYLS